MALFKYLEKHDLGVGVKLIYLIKNSHVTHKNRDKRNKVPETRLDSANCDVRIGSLCSKLTKLGWIQF